VGAGRCDCVAIGVVCRRGSGTTLTPSLSRRAREQGDAPDCHRRHERPQRMIRREHFRVAMPVLARRRAEPSIAPHVTPEVVVESVVSTDSTTRIPWLPEFFVTIEPRLTVAFDV